MDKKYFKEFDFIKEAEGAKSLSFFATTPNTPFSHKLFEEFHNILEKYEERFRISLHNSSEDDLHNMVIGMKRGSFVYPHKHNKSESYQILSGKVALLYFDDNGLLIKNLILSSKKNLIARVDKGSYHALIALQNSIYHEVRIGPFTPKGDSTFGKWFEEDKKLYMNKLLQKIEMESKCV